MLKKLVFTSTLAMPLSLLQVTNTVGQHLELKYSTENFINNEKDNFKITMQNLLHSFHDQNTSLKHKLPSEIGQINQIVSQEELGILYVKIPEYMKVELSIHIIDDIFGQLSVNVNVYEISSNEENETIITAKASRIMNISDFKKLELI